MSIVTLLIAMVVQLILAAVSRIAARRLGAGHHRPHVGRSSGRGRRRLIPVISALAAATVAGGTLQGAFLSVPASAAVSQNQPGQGPGPSQPSQGPGPSRPGPGHTPPVQWSGSSPRPAWLGRPDNPLTTAEEQQLDKLTGRFRRAVAEFDKAKDAFAAVERDVASLEQQIAAAQPPAAGPAGRFLSWMSGWAWQAKLAGLKAKLVASQAELSELSGTESTLRSRAIDAGTAVTAAAARLGALGRVAAVTAEWQQIAAEPLATGQRIRGRSAEDQSTHKVTWRWAYRSKRWIQVQSHLPVQHERGELDMGQVINQRMTRSPHALHPANPSLPQTNAITKSLAGIGQFLARTPLTAISHREDWQATEGEFTDPVTGSRYKYTERTLVKASAEDIPNAVRLHDIARNNAFLPLIPLAIPEHQIPLPPHVFGIHLPPHVTTPPLNGTIGLSVETVGNLQIANGLHYEQRVNHVRWTAVKISGPGPAKLSGGWDNPQPGHLSSQSKQAEKVDVLIGTLTFRPAGTDIELPLASLLGNAGISEVKLSAELSYTWPKDMSRRDAVMTIDVTPTIELLGEWSHNPLSITNQIIQAIARAAGVPDPGITKLLSEVGGYVDSSSEKTLVLPLTGKGLAAGDWTRLTGTTWRAFLRSVASGLSVLYAHSEVNKDGVIIVPVHPYLRAIDLGDAAALDARAAADAADTASNSAALALSAADSALSSAAQTLRTAQQAAGTNPVARRLAHDAARLLAQARALRQQAGAQAAGSAGAARQARAAWESAADHANQGADAADPEGKQRAGRPAEIVSRAPLPHGPRILPPARVVYQHTSAAGKDKETAEKQGTIARDAGAQAVGLADRVTLVSHVAEALARAGVARAAADTDSALATAAQQAAQDLVNWAHTAQNVAADAQAHVRAPSSGKISRSAQRSARAATASSAGGHAAAIVAQRDAGDLVRRFATAQAEATAAATTADSAAAALSAGDAAAAQQHAQDAVNHSTSVANVMQPTAGLLQSTKLSAYQSLRQLQDAYQQAAQAYQQQAAADVRGLRAELQPVAARADTLLQAALTARTAAAQSAAAATDPDAIALATRADAVVTAAANLRKSVLPAVRSRIDSAYRNASAARAGYLAAQQAARTQNLTAADAATAATRQSAAAAASDAVAARQGLTQLTTAQDAIEQEIQSIHADTDVLRAPGRVPGEKNPQGRKTQPLAETPRDLWRPVPGTTLVYPYAGLAYSPDTTAATGDHPITEPRLLAEIHVNSTDLTVLEGLVRSLLPWMVAETKYFDRETMVSVLPERDGLVVFVSSGSQGSVPFYSKDSGFIPLLHVHPLDSWAEGSVADYRVVDAFGLPYNFVAGPVQAHTDNWAVARVSKGGHGVQKSRRDAARATPLSKFSLGKPLSDWLRRAMEQAPSRLSAADLLTIAAPAVHSTTPAQVADLRTAIGWLLDAETGRASSPAPDAYQNVFMQAVRSWTMSPAARGALVRAGYAAWYGVGTRQDVAVLKGFRDALVQQYEQAWKLLPQGKRAGLPDPGRLIATLTNALPTKSAARPGGSVRASGTLSAPSAVSAPRQAEVLDALYNSLRGLLGGKPGISTSQLGQLARHLAGMVWNYPGTANAVAAETAEEYAKALNLTGTMAPAGKNGTYTSEQFAQADVELFRVRNTVMASDIAQRLRAIDVPVSGTQLARTASDLATLASHEPGEYQVVDQQAVDELAAHYEKALAVTGGGQPSEQQAGMAFQEALAEQLPSQEAFDAATAQRAAAPTKDLWNEAYGAYRGAQINPEQVQRNQLSSVIWQRMQQQVAKALSRAQTQAEAQAAAKDSSGRSYTITEDPSGRIHTLTDTPSEEPAGASAQSQEGGLKDEMIVKAVDELMAQGMTDQAYIDAASAEIANVLAERAGYSDFGSAMGAADQAGGGGAIKPLTNEQVDSLVGTIVNRVRDAMPAQPTQGETTNMPQAGASEASRTATLDQLRNLQRQITNASPDEVSAIRQQIDDLEGQLYPQGFSSTGNYANGYQAQQSVQRSSSSDAARGDQQLNTESSAGSSSSSSVSGNYADGYGPGQTSRPTTAQENPQGGTVQQQDTSTADRAPAGNELPPYESGYTGSASASATQDTSIPSNNAIDDTTVGDMTPLEPTDISAADGGVAALAASAPDAVKTVELGTDAQQSTVPQVVAQEVLAQDQTLARAEQIAQQNGEPIPSDPTQLLTDPQVTTDPGFQQDATTSADTAAFSKSPAEVRLLSSYLAQDPQAQQLITQLNDRASQCGWTSQCAGSLETQWDQYMQQSEVKMLAQHDLLLGGTNGQQTESTLQNAGIPDGLASDESQLRTQLASTQSGQWELNQAASTADQIQQGWQQQGVDPAVIAKAKTGDPAAVNTANQTAALNETTGTSADITGYSQLVSGYHFDPNQTSQQNLDNFGNYVSSMLSSNAKYASVALPNGSTPFAGNGEISYTGGQFTSTDPANATAVAAATQLNMAANGAATQTSLYGQAKAAAVADLKKQGYNVWQDSKGNIMIGGGQDATTISQSLNDSIQQHNQDLTTTYRANLANAKIWASSTLTPLPGESQQDYLNRLAQQSNQVAVDETLGKTQQQAQATVLAENHTAAHFMGNPDNSSSTDTSVPASSSSTSTLWTEANAPAGGYCHGDGTCGWSTPDTGTGSQSATGGNSNAGTTASSTSNRSVTTGCGGLSDCASSSPSQDTSGQNDSVVGAVGNVVSNLWNQITGQGTKSADKNTTASTNTTATSTTALANASTDNGCNCDGKASTPPDSTTALANASTDTGNNNDGNASPGDNGGGTKNTSGSPAPRGHIAGLAGNSDSNNSDNNNNGGRNSSNNNGDTNGSGSSSSAPRGHIAGLAGNSDSNSDSNSNHDSSNHANSNNNSSNHDSSSSSSAPRGHIAGLAGNSDSNSGNHASSNNNSGNHSSSSHDSSSSSSSAPRGHIAGLAGNSDSSNNSSSSSSGNHGNSNSSSSNSNSSSAPRGHIAGLAGNQ
jgi:hypothetical protein